MMHLSPRLVLSTLATLSLTLAACGDDDAPTADGGPPDAATADAGIDGAPAPDAGPDSGLDAAGDVCAPRIECPAPSPNQLTLCGQLYDLGTSVPLRAEAPTGAACAEPTADGPCALALSAYDVIEVITQPGNPEPLPTDSVTVDDCGRFRLDGVSSPPSSRLAMLAEAAEGEDFRRTGIVFGVTGGQSVLDLELYSLSTATDLAWSSSAGLKGDSFASRGVIVGLFANGDAPVAGVTFESAVGATFPDQDSYFSDANPAQRLTVDPAQAATGANGTGLLIDLPSVGAYTGDAASAPEGCEWPVAQAATIADVVFVQPFDAICD
jgi:hypothetical protein